MAAMATMMAATTLTMAATGAAAAGAGAGAAVVSPGGPAGGGAESDRIPRGLKTAFREAVDVIRRLPRDGTVQFTQEEKIKERLANPQFYGLYQQVSAGPNTAEKPAFYDVVAVAKWTSWKSLRNVSRADAMRQYVNLLIQIMQRFSTDPQVAGLVDRLRTSLNRDANASSSLALERSELRTPGGRPDAAPAASRSAMALRTPSASAPLVPAAASAIPAAPVEPANPAPAVAPATGRIPTASTAEPVAAEAAPTVAVAAAAPVPALDTTAPSASIAAAAAPATDVIAPGDVVHVSQGLTQLERHLEQVTDKLSQLDSHEQRAVALWRRRFWIVLVPLVAVLLRYVVLRRWYRSRSSAANL